MVEKNRKTPYLILGALGFGSFLPIEKSFELLNKASESGIVDIDCAVSYGNGTARQIIGSFHKLGGYRFNIWEKIGLEMYEVSFGNFEAITKFPHIDKVGFEISKLLDIYQIQHLYSIQLHAPLTDSFRSNFLSSLKQELNKRSFEHLGIANHETTDLIKLKHDCDIIGIRLSTNQVHFNIAEQKAKNDIIAYSISANIPVVANRTLARGLLAHTILKNSLRLVVSDKTRVQYIKFENLYEGIKSILSKVADRPVSESAISWVLQQEGIHAVTLGISSLDQLHSAIQAINYPLDKSHVELINLEICRRFGETIFNLPREMFDRDY